MLEAASKRNFAESSLKRKKKKGEKEKMGKGDSL